MKQTRIIIAASVALALALTASDALAQGANTGVLIPNRPAAQAAQPTTQVAAQASVATAARQTAAPLPPASGITVSGVTMTNTVEGPRLEMTLAITSNAVTNLQSIAVVPTLAGKTGQNAAFPHVLVNGRNRSQIYERETVFGYPGITGNPPYLVMNIDPKHPGGRVDYSAWVTGEEWMEGADLSLAFVLVSPAGELQSYSTAVSGTSVVTVPEGADVTSQPTVTETQPEPQPQVTVPPPPVTQPAVTQPAVVQPQPESQVAVVVPPPATQTQPQPQVTQPQPQPAVVVPPPATQPQPQPQVVQPQPQPAYQPVAANVRTIQGTARLDFDTSSAVLAPDRGRNPGELAAITDAVVRTGATRIIGITVTGYSSPDGRSETNAALARDRAAALGRYLQEMYRLPANAVVVRGEGEDWVGLRGMVGASSLPYISEILKVIDSSSAPDAKESLMRRMMGGQIWQRMEREIFPELRKVDYTIEYEAAQ